MNRFFWITRKLIILTLTLSIVFILAILYYMEYELPDIDALNTVQLQVPLQIFTQDKKLIATIGEKRRFPLTFNDIPKPFIDAVLATEDQRYFQHAGVDFQGLGRAGLALILTGKKLQGGSTITMQVARSFYLTRHKTFSRKLREILLAIKIENKLSKEKILELYLNKVFLGNRAYGVEAAAQTYYGKHLNELTLAQFAMIAGLPKAPSTLNPLANPKLALRRRDHVLTRMYDEGYIDESTYQKAVNEPLIASYHDLKTELYAPYVSELVRIQLEQMYGDSIYTDGFKVYTTIDSRLQKIAQDAVRDGLLAYDQRHGYRGPAKNLGIPSIENMEKWVQTLSKEKEFSGLEPAAVFEITDQTITVLRQNGDLTIIPWSGLKWARKQVNPDYLGPMPQKASQIVKLGDLVYITAFENGFKLAQLPKAEACFVSISPENGSILAMVGGFDFRQSNFNRTIRAERQPGSSFKPFIYSAALEKGYTLSTVINDAPIVIENPTDNSLWRPQNVNHKFYGPTRLRTAIIQSRNLVSVRLLALIGLPYTLKYLERFGFVPAQLPPGLSLALGTAMVTPLQMAQGYAILANGGFRVTPFLIDSIENTQDKLIFTAKPKAACYHQCDPKKNAAVRMITPQNTFLITSALHDVIEKGTARRASNMGRQDLAGKTGTTQNQVDAWFAGYNPDLVAISWVGFDQQQSLHEYGAQAALPIWIQFMEKALKNKPEHYLEQPPGIVSVKIDPETGQRTGADGSGIFEFYMLPFLPDREVKTNLEQFDDQEYSGEETEDQADFDSLDDEEEADTLY